METRRWTNPHQPQTLQIAVFLLYASAVMTLLGLSNLYEVFGARVGMSELMWIVASATLAAGGFGIANDKKWGYAVAVAITGIGVLELLLRLVDLGIGYIVDPDFLLLALFPVARFALLVHPQSREHQRIWFS
ncbi:MAG: hypothetical protein JJE52_03650 [Acidimicrobiia bacterium]|nr:hypothetical protein [Acidimicrobiia bacterium]